MATAAKTSAVPSQPMRLRIRLTMVSYASRRGALCAPPLAIDRLGGQEEPERDEAHVIDDVRRVDDAFAEIVEVVDDRQIVHELVDHRPREAAKPGNHPQE